MADGDVKSLTQKTTAKAGAVFGRGFLYDLWYFAALSSELKPGKLARYEMLGEPVLIGRTKAGVAYALRDICPHRAAPLSAGALVKDDQGAEAVQMPLSRLDVPDGRWRLFHHPLPGGGAGA